MKGTIFSQRLEIAETPPKMGIAERTTMMMPMIQGSISTPAEVMMPVMELACTAQPMPRAANAVKMAKAAAPSFAHQGVVPSSRTKARRQAYIAPPTICPLASFTRYLREMYTSEYLVAIPKIPVSHIQRMAPGPPMRSAVATPTMDPVPMVAARAVARAPKPEISPSPEPLLSEILIAKGSLRWMKPVRMVR